MDEPRYEKLVAFALVFWISFFMWMGFATGIINGLYPIRGITESFDIVEVVWQTLFYFVPHLLIALIVYYKYDWLKQKG